MNNVLAQIDAYSGGTGSAVSGGKVTLNAGTTAALTIGGSGLAKLGLVAGTTAQSTPANTGLSGLNLTIGATGGGVATNITFGTGAGQISNLNDLNTALAGNNLQASINTTGQITLTTTNNAASFNIGAIGGTATNPGAAFAGVSVVNTVADADSQTTRANLVAQYNNDHRADHDDLAGLVLQRHQSAQWRRAQADLQRDRQVDAKHQGRQLSTRPVSGLAPLVHGHGLSRQQFSTNR